MSAFCVARGWQGLAQLSCVLLTLGCGRQEPRLDELVPALGDAGGGTRVRLVGAGFVDRGPVVVYFGLRSARAVTIVDDRQITVVTPEAEAFGPTDVRVEFADGTRFERAQAFDYTTVDGKLKEIPFVPGKAPVPTAQ